MRGSTLCMCVCGAKIAYWSEVNVWCVCVVLCAMWCILFELCVLWLIVVSITVSLVILVQCSESTC